MLRVVNEYFCLFVADFVMLHVEIREHGVPTVLKPQVPSLIFTLKPHETSSLARSPQFNTPNSSPQKKTRVKIWLYEDTRMTIEGQIIGFDEYMNFVLDGAQEIDTKTEKRTDVGRILLKGDAITLMQEA